MTNAIAPVSAVSAISPTAPSVSAATQAAGLEAQIAMYRHQLSGMVNCASATTIAGQNAIGELASKIDTTMERLDAVAALKAGDASEKLQGSAAAPETHPLTEQGGEAAAPGSTSTQTEAQRLAPTGALLNVFV